MRTARYVLLLVLSVLPGVVFVVAATCCDAQEPLQIVPVISAGPADQRNVDQRNNETTLLAGQVGVPYDFTLTANFGTPPYTWSIVSGHLPRGLTLNGSTGVISGTPAIVGVSTFTVQVQDSQMHTAQEFLSITIAAVTNATLSGNYVVTFSGYKNGNPVIMAGSFIADGKGNLTSGVLDVNDGSGEPLSGHNVTPQTLTAGSVYSMGSSGLGTMTIVTNLGSYPFAIALTASACSVNPNFLSACGRIIQRDPANPRNYGSGVIKVQNPQYFPLNAFFPGNFTMLISGTDPSGNRYAGAGAFGTNTVTKVDIDCSSATNGNGWGLDSCPSDINDAGQTGSDPIKGSFSSTINQTTGRGNFVNLTFQHDPSQRCTQHWCNYAYYVVDHSQMVLISTDPISTPANMTLWFAIRQMSNSGWSSTALYGASVMELNAVGGSSQADIMAGLLVADGAGNAILKSDENQGGTMYLQQIAQGTYSFDASGQKTGRATTSGFSTQFGSTPPVLYLIGTNYAVVVGTDARITSGMLEPQSGAPFSNAALSGVYAGGSSWPVLSTVTNSAMTMFADESGSITAIQDTSGPGGPGGPSRLALSYQVDGSGRAVLRQNGSLYGIAYVVSPNKVVLLPVGSAPTLSILASGPTN